MASLYHYTSGDSLLGILRSQSFWATDIRFLNDYEELNRGLDIFESFAEGLVEDMKTDTEHLSQLVKIFVGNIRRNANLTLINLVSFSTEPDNLRQWMAYCNSGIGYSIEFDPDLLIPASLSDFKHCLRLSPVEYIDSDESFYRSNSLVKFKDFLVESLTGMDKSISEELLIEQVSLKANTLFINSMFLASSIKPVEFSDEREIRLLYIGENKESETNSHEMEGLRTLYNKPPLPDLGYKATSDLLVPYQPIPFNIDAVKRIIIGPAANTKLAETGIAEFRDRNNLKFDITHSACSLRRL
ncbi:DUF2971 domain-containing protein [uncultured Psychrosphaera sp.]|uniref:DUF2971 domain-containing protein n=1 Tax=uncultured Psychrosphaera sp. TaxID=1403522 RepID=UPI0026090755|nr:DUF2971 domain-containing protein [uncultured Psychrosphaera sp.]